MSFVPGVEHDVFLSYAWADNNYNNGWISYFRRYLLQMLRAGLDRENFREDDIAQLDVFIDKKGFESSGRVAEIVTHAAQSAFLFVFVGKKYARSTWCAKELAAFAETRGSLDAAIDRTWTVVLERAALRLEPEGGSNEASERLADLLETGIQNRFFDEDGRTIRAFNPVGEDLNPTGPFIDRCQPIIDDLVAKLVAHRRVVKREAEVRVFPPPPARPASALIMVESNPEDAPLTADVKDVIRSTLATVFQGLRVELGLPPDYPSLAVEFDMLDWKLIEPMDSLPSAYHGIVVVDGAKDGQALIAQVNRLREKIWRSRPGMVQAMWVLPPKREAQFRPGSFQILRFTLENGRVRYDPAELKEFVRRILGVLQPLPHAA